MNNCKNQIIPWSKIIPMSFQHLFVMFGATILVPIIFNINPSTVLFFNGIGTLLYLLICNFRIPAYLGSSFAFISPVTLLLPLNYNLALGGFIFSGLILCLIALIVKKVGIKWLDTILPPAAMGAIIIVIGLELAEATINMCSLNDVSTKTNLNSLIVSCFTLLVTMFFLVFFEGFMSIISILIGIISGYCLAYYIGMVDIKQIEQASWFKIPIFYTPKFEFSAILTILPALTIIFAEHISHFITISNILNKNLTKNPGLHKSLFANGLTIIISGLFGSVPNTTYGENIAILAITKIYNSIVIAFTAILAISFSCIEKLSAFIISIPMAVIGGISIIIYGAISVSGIKFLIDKKVDYNNTKNLILTSIILTIGLGKAKISIGFFELKGMTLAAIVGIFLSILFKLLPLLKKKY